MGLDLGKISEAILGFLGSMNNGNAGGGLGAGGWSSVVGGASNMVSSLLPEPKEYSGAKGDLTQGLDGAYDKISDIAGNFGPTGLIIGAAMKVNALAGKGIKALGGGTDGMTTTDAILGSQFMQMTPLGMINGFGGKKTDTITKDADTFGTIGSSYTGTSDTVDTAVENSGKKYGLFSSGARKKMNKYINMMGRLLNTMSDIATNTNMNNDMLANQTSIQAYGSAYESAGGYDMTSTRAARHGMKFTMGLLNKAKQLAYPKMNIFKNGGLVSTLKRISLQKMAVPKSVSRAIRLAKIGSKIEEPFIVNWDCLEETILYALDGNKFDVPMLSNEDKLKIVDLVNESLANFVKRLKEPTVADNNDNNADNVIQFDDGLYVNFGDNPLPLDLGDGLLGTHKLSWAIEELDGKDVPIIYPNILNINGKLVDFSDSPYDPTFALLSAIKNKDFVIMPSELAAEWYTNDNYKAYYPWLQKYAPNNNELLLSKDGEILSTKGESVEIDGTEYIDDGLDNKGHRFLDHLGNLYYFKSGGTMNLIPEGALHKNKHHMENDENITKKGIPVVIENKDGEFRQLAEIECNEIIFNLEVTKKLEELNKKYYSEESSLKEKDEAAIEAGKLLTDEILNNTDDRTGLILTVE